MAMTDTKLRGFSVFVRAAVNHFTRSELVGYEAISKKKIYIYYECVSLFLPELSGMKIASFLRRVILPPLAGLAVPYYCSTLSHKRHDIWKNNHCT
jgi:hypothetical protein